MAQRVDKMCSLSNEQLFFYGIYSSKFNKETLISLKEDFTLPELIDHQEFITIQEDLEAEAMNESKKDSN